MADKLADEPTRHWAGAVQSLLGLVRVDGKTFRIMGTDPVRTPENLQAPALEQTALRVLPTHTIWEFTGAGVIITLTFLTPALSPANASPLTLLSGWTTPFDREIAAT